MMEMKNHAWRIFGGVLCAGATITAMVVAQPSEPDRPQLRADEVEFLRQLRSDVGSPFSTPGGLLNDEPNATDAHPATGRLDPQLAVSLRHTSRQLESHARRAVSTGNWDWGIRLHRLADELDALTREVTTDAQTR
mgnify:CR=1 FL=1